MNDYCSGTLSRGRRSFWISDDVVSVSFASPGRGGRGERPQVNPLGLYEHDMASVWMQATVWWVFGIEVARRK